MYVLLGITLIPERVIIYFPRNFYPLISYYSITTILTNFIILSNGLILYCLFSIWVSWLITSLFIIVIINLQFLGLVKCCNLINHKGNYLRNICLCKTFVYKDGFVLLIVGSTTHEYICLLTWYLLMLLAFYWRLFLY